MNKRIIVLRRADMSDDDIARFWKKVDRSGDCWEWTAYIIPNRYGQIRFHGKGVLAHRFSYAIAHGECPTELQVDHMCHNRRCVNPSHLQLVTRQQNNENKIAMKNGKSGIRGVGWNTEANKWKVHVVVKGKDYFGGYYCDVHEAEKSAIALRNKLMTNNLLDRKE